MKKPKVKVYLNQQVWGIKRYKVYDKFKKSLTKVCTFKSTKFEVKKSLS